MEVKKENNRTFESQYRRLRHGFQVMFILIFISPALGFHFYQGTLMAGSIFGIDLLDPVAFMESILASWEIHLSSVLSAAIVLVFFTLIGGRFFCGWVCPMYFVTEAGEKIREFFLGKNLKKNLPAGIKIQEAEKILERRTFSGKLKFQALVFFLGLSLLTGLPVFEIFSPIGIVGRSLAYGAGLSILLILAIILFESFVSKRGWCHYICPVGALYSLVGRLAPLRINLDAANCTQCGKCQKVCMVPEVLDKPLERAKIFRGGKNPLSQWESVRGGDCTYCLECLDICPERVIKLKKYHSPLVINQFALNKEEK
jgi:ferredoxin-type protein NapH